MSGRIKRSMELDGDIWKAILLWRNTPNKMDSSPVQRMFSRRTRCAVPVVKSKLKPKVIPNVEENIIDNRRKAKKYYDRRARILPELEIGQPVYVQTKPQLNSNWESGVVTERLNPRSYTVEVPNGQLRRNRENIKSTPNKVTNDFSSYDQSSPKLSISEPLVTSSESVQSSSEPGLC